MPSGYVLRGYVDALERRIAYLAAKLRKTELPRRFHREEEEIMALRYAVGLIVAELETRDAVAPSRWKAEQL